MTTEPYLGHGPHPKDPLLVRALYRFAEAASVVVMSAYVVLILTQVILRYGFNDSIFWSEELVRFGLVWNVMLGAALVSYRDAHIRVDILEKLISMKARIALKAFIHFCSICFIALLLWFGVAFLLHTAVQRSAVLDAPMSVAYASIAVGAALMLVFTITAALRQTRTGS